MECVDGWSVKKRECDAKGKCSIMHHRFGMHGARIHCVNSGNNRCKCGSSSRKSMPMFRALWMRAAAVFLPLRLSHSLALLISSAGCCEFSFTNSFVTFSSVTNFMLFLFHIVRFAFWVATDAMTLQCILCTLHTHTFPCFFSTLYLQ